MKLSISATILYCFFTMLLAASTQAAGLLKPVHSQLPDLEIQQHHVDVVIEDGYAVTTIDQVFFNPSSQQLEAIYSFPVPEDSAVGEFTYWIDGKPVTGEVVEKQQARTIYENEKSAGRQAAIVEQDDYKTFDMTVYPVPAMDTVKTRLVYIQPVHVETGVGRYVYPLEEGGVDEERLAFWSRNEKVTQQFGFNLKFRSSYPVDAIRLPQHSAAVVQQISNQHWQVALSNQQPVAEQENQSVQPTTIRLDKDIVVYWRHQEGLPGSVDLVTYREASDRAGTFMMTFTPGDDLGAIESGKDWIFVLDTSGSMQGKFATLIEGVRQGLGKLRAQDRFKIVLFSNGATVLNQSYTDVNPLNVDNALAQLNNVQPGGGTNLYAGLEAALKGLDDDRPSGVILVTDGVANVGVTEKKRFLKLLEDADVRLFTFIMGNSANRPLLEGMADVSHGFAMSVSNSDDIVGQIMAATQKLTHHAYRDIDIDISGVRAKDQTPKRINSLYRGEQLVVFGHYFKPGAAQVTLTATVDGQQKQYRTQVEFPDNDTLNPELERLWAFASIENLQKEMDYFGADKDREQALTDIAKQYGLVTPYTSMIVVREEVFQQLGIKRTNKERVAKEQAAREQRNNAPTRDHRADTQAPMFSSKRPSMGGSSSFSPWFVALAGLLLIVARRRRVVIE